MSAEEKAVEGTADDATLCKLYCIQKGYFQDTFLQHFVSRAPPKRPPMINRGYWSRVAAF